MISSKINFNHFSSISGPKFSVTVHLVLFSMSVGHYPEEWRSRLFLMPENLNIWHNKLSYKLLSKLWKDFCRTFHINIYGHFVSLLQFKTILTSYRAKIYLDSLSLFIMLGLKKTTRECRSNFEIVSKFVVNWPQFVRYQIRLMLYTAVAFSVNTSRPDLYLKAS